MENFYNNICTVGPLSKDNLNIVHNTLNLSIKDKLYGPYRIMTTQSPPKENNLCNLYNSKILAGPEVSIITV